MTATQAVLAAKSVLPGSPEHAVACELSKLRGYDQNMRVVARGFDESGYDDIDTFEIVHIVKVREVSGHCPMYDELSIRDEPLGPEFDALLIDF